VLLAAAHGLPDMIDRKQRSLQGDAGRKHSSHGGRRACRKNSCARATSAAISRLSFSSSACASARIFGNRAVNSGDGGKRL
jgi:hypothetical protein